MCYETSWIALETMEASSTINTPRNSSSKLTEVRWWMLRENDQRIKGDRYLRVLTSFSRQKMKKLV